MSEEKCLKSILLLTITTIAIAGLTARVHSIEHSIEVSKVPVPEGKYSPAIYAAASINFSDERNSALRHIARKSDITEVEQIYILEVLQVTDGFSGDKKAVLLSLLKNQSIAQSAKRKMSELLPKLGLFSDDAKEITIALAE